VSADRLRALNEAGMLTDDRIACVAAAARGRTSISLAISASGSWKNTTPIVSRKMSSALCSAWWRRRQGILACQARAKKNGIPDEDPQDDRHRASPHGPPGIRTAAARRRGGPRRERTERRERWYGDALVEPRTGWRLDGVPLRDRLQLGRDRQTGRRRCESCATRRPRRP